MNLDMAANADGGARVHCAPPLEVLVLLLERLDADIARAVEAERLGDLVESTQRLSHARDIVFELLNSLDTERGGEIAANLSRLYTWAAARLFSPADRDEVHGAHEALREILVAFRGLREQHG